MATTSACIHCNASGINYYLAYPASGSGQDTQLMINPNGGTIYLKSLTDPDTTVATLTSTYTFYRSGLNSYDTGSGYVQIYCKYNPPSGKTLAGIAADAGNQGGTLTFVSWSNSVLKVNFSSIQPGATIALKLTWKNSGTTYTNCSAPTQVRVGSSSTHSNNSSSYSVAVPDPGSFYITWNAGSGGTNTSVASYTRKVVKSSDYTATTTNLYSQSTGWLGSNAGTSAKCYVKSNSSPSGYDSAYSSAYGTVNFTSGSSSSGYTLTCNVNGGQPTEGYSYTKSALTRQTISTPTRSGYTFGGWYLDNTSTSTALNYGKGAKYSGSISVSFWTYASKYTHSATYATVFGCAQGGGYDFFFTSAGKATWEFHDGSSYKTVTTSSAVSGGYHYWCCLFDASNKRIRLYMDGSLVGTTSTSGTTCSYPSGTNLFLGADSNSSGAAESAFVGQIGNFAIYNDNSARTSPTTTIFTVPAQSATVKARWTANTYTVTLNKNGGSGGTNSVSITYGTAVGSYPSITLPTRAGYTFAGYYTATSGGTQYYNAQGNSVRTFNIASNTTWYAQWTPISGTIYYHAGQYYKENNPSYNLGIPKSGFSLITYLSSNQYGFIADSSSNIKTESYNINSNDLDLYNTTTLMEPPPGCVHSPVATQWKIWNGTKGSWVNQTGVSSASWDVGSLVANGTITAGDYLVAFANWLPNTYTLTFNADGGSVSPSTKSVTYGTTYTDLPTPTRPGYSFGGWYAKFNGSSDFINYGRAYTFNNKLHIHVMAYMSNWSSYTGVMRMFSCTEGGGWNIETQNTDKISSALYDYNVGYKALTSTVPWSALSSGWHHFDLVFDGSKGSLYFDRILIAESETFTSGKIGYHNTNSIFVGAEAGSSPTTPPNNFFNGYIGNVIIYNSSDYSTSTPTSSYYNTFTTPAQDVTLYPRWKANTYTVTFNKQEGTGGTDSVTVTYGSSMPTITVPSKADNEFLGYYDAESGGTRYYSASGWSVKDWDKTSDSILYAHWQSTLCTLTMDPAGGKWGGSTTPTAVSTTINYPVLLSAPIYGFRVFRGWYNGNTLAGFDGDTFIPTEATITLTAHWYDKYFVAISDGTNIKKAIPFVADTTNDEWKMMKSYVNVNNSWKPSGQLPPDDGYTHVVLADTQNFSVPNRDYESTPDNDYDWIISLTPNSAFTSTITSDADWLEFVNNCKRIRVIYDGTTIEDIIMTENEKYPQWQGSDSEILLNTSILEWAFNGSYYNNNFNLYFGNYAWDSEYNGTTHSVKIEALI